MSKPTPPGTGVICEATSLTVAKSTSPTSPVLEAVHAHVDHHGAGLDHRGGDEPRAADGHDQDVGPPRDGRQVAGAAVADGHRGVAARGEKGAGAFCRTGPSGASHKRRLSPFAPALHQQDGHRLADDVASAHNDHFRAGGRNVVAAQDLEDAVRGAWQEPRAALHEPADVLRMEGVDVLQRIDRIEHARSSIPRGSGNWTRIP